MELGQPRQEQRNRRDWPGPLVSILVRVEQVTPVSSIFQSIGRSRFSGYEGSVREILVGYGWNPVKEVQQATIALIKDFNRVHTLIKYQRSKERSLKSHQFTVQKSHRSLKLAQSHSSFKVSQEQKARSVSIVQPYLLSAGNDNKTFFIIFYSRINKSFFQPNQFSVAGQSQLFFIQLRQ